MGNSVTKLPRFARSSFATPIRFPVSDAGHLLSTDTVNIKPLTEYSWWFYIHVHPQGLGIVGTNPHKGYLAILNVLNSTLSVWVVFYKMTQMTHSTRVLRGILRERFKIRNGLE